MFSGLQLARSDGLEPATAGGAAVSSCDDLLPVEKGSLARQLRQRFHPVCRNFVDPRDRVSPGRMGQKASRDVALRRAYCRCVRNVSARSTSRQQQSADLQALYRSPLTDSNRRPPPYHGGALPTELRGRGPSVALIRPSKWLLPRALRSASLFLWPPLHSHSPWGVPDRPLRRRLRRRPERPGRLRPQRPPGGVPEWPPRRRLRRRPWRPGRLCRRGRFPFGHRYNSAPAKGGVPEWPPRRRLRRRPWRPGRLCRRGRFPFGH